MRFSPQFLDELRARLPVSEVVGRRVKLHKAGREWKGLSPFNKEKTPSFFVNDQKQAWFDFSSGKNGNIFDFRHAHRGRELPGSGRAPRRSGRRAAAGVSPEAEAREERRKTLHDVVELAAKFFERRLAARGGARGRGYLADRGLDLGDAAQIPPRLCAGGAICAQGASRRGENPGRGHDRSRPDRRRREISGAVRSLPRPRHVPDQRLARPGRSRSAAARWKKKVSAKYLNSPETPLFHKGATLYNIAARRARRRTTAPAVIAVEGYVDVHRHGDVPVTRDRRAARHRTHRRAVGADVAAQRRANLCFDGDDAGRQRRPIARSIWRCRCSSPAKA